MASGSELALKLIMQLKDEATEKIGGLGKTLESLGTVGTVAGAAVAAGVVAIGSAAFAAGQQWDDAMDAITISTGATGEDLAQLEEDFKAVFTSIPTKAGPAAEAISELNKRLGVTGPVLQDVSKNVLEASRLMGTDAKASAEGLGQAMLAWGKDTEQAAQTMDMFFVASQQSGVGMEQLMTSVQNAAPMLKGLGFSMEDSIALFANFEKAGVDGSTAMTALRRAAAQFTEQGIPMKEGLAEVVQRIQEATTEEEALSIGFETFGSRAGPAMVTAIRNGSFSLEEMNGILAESQGAILATADATADFPEKFAVLQNVVTTALAPLGLALMDIVTTLVERLSPALIALAGYVQPVMDILTGLIQVIVLGEEPLGDWSTWWETIAGIFGEDVANAISDVATWIQNLMQTIGGFIQSTLIPFVQAHLPELKGALIAIGAVLAGAAIVSGIVAIAGAIAALANPITAIIVVVGLLGAAWEGNWGGIQEKTAAAIEWLGGAWETLKTGISGLSEWLTGAWETIKTTFSTALTAIWGYVDQTWTDVQATTTAAWDFATGVGAFLTTTWETIKTTFSDALGLIWQGVGETWKGIWETTTDAWSSIVSWLGEKVGGIWSNAIKPGLDLVWQNFRNFWETLFDNIHIKTPHFTIKWKEVFGVSIPVGVSVAWYGMGGDFITNGPMLIGVGERGPERVQITPLGQEGKESGVKYVIEYHDHRLVGEIDLQRLLQVAERLEWRARMRR